jgi:AraC-like DNA-binding protein
VADTAGVATLPIQRHLLRARDLADVRYAEPIGVADMAAAAGLSQAHFARAFRDAFGVTPHGYLLTRRLERAAALLRQTDRSVADICMQVGLSSVGSFTTSFKRRFGRTPVEYREAFAPTAAAFPLPSCVVRAYIRPR